MATKLETMNYLTQNYNTEEAGEDLLKFEFEIDDDRTQLLFAKVLNGLLVMDSPFASTEDINANIAFKLAEESVLGVKRVGELFTVRHVIPIADIDESEIDLGLRITAQTADQLESEVGGDKF